MNDRIPPHSLESEAALLGALMIARDYVPLAVCHVTAGDFYGIVNAEIYSAIVALHDANQPTDKIAVAEALRSKGKLEKCGGVSYLSSLYESVQTASTVEYHAKIIAEKSLCRKLIAAGAEITSCGFDGEDDPAEALAKAESSLRSVTGNATRSDAGETLEQVAGRIMIATSNANDAAKKLGTTSPWPTFDRATGLTFGGELVVWAAAPGVGKSMAVVQLAEHVASSHGPVAFFALEMGAAATARRMLAKHANVASRRLRLGDLRGNEWDRLGESYDGLAALPMTLFDRVPRRSVADVRRCVRRMALDAPVTAVVIDHVNFLSDAVAQSRVSKNERLDGVYQGLLEIAAEFDCVMHVVQHFNREGASGEPGLQHLRDGGNLEGHANIIVFPIRRDMAREPERGEFIIAKNRESELCRIPMRFDGFAQSWIDERASCESLALEAVS